MSISPEVGAPITLHSAHINNAVSGHRITADSRTVVFTDFTMGWRGLYSVPIARPSAARVVLLGSGDGSVATYDTTPDSRWVIYRAGGTGSPMRIYRVHTLGRDDSAEPISRSFLPTGSLAISPDSSRVAFIASEASGAPLDVCVVSVGYPAYVVRVSDSPDVSRVVAQFVPSVDGSEVFYRADHDVAGTVELYRGSLVAPPTKINDPLGAGGNVVAFEIDPSGAVVYLADQVTDGAFELFSVLPSYPPPATKISDTLVTGGSVSAFRINSVRQRAVYLADQETPGEAELYAVFVEGPVTGAGPAVIKLSGPLAAGGEVLDFGLTADGSRVVYRARQDSADVAELYVADYGPFRFGFDATALTVAEGAGAASVTVRLSEASIGPTSADYVVGADSEGGATSADFGATSGTLLFAPGETEKTVSVTIHDDGIDEDDEWFEVSLVSATGGYLRYPASVRVTIVDDDQPQSTPTPDPTPQPTLEPPPTPTPAPTPKPTETATHLGLHLPLVLK